MSEQHPLIVGAGLAGLLAAYAWPRAKVVEAAPAPVQSHRAVLRFRSLAVPVLTGIEFRPVLVRKGIWEGGRFIRPNIRSANAYTQKTHGRGILLGERSVWNLDPVERYVAPEDLYARMVEHVGSRIEWGARFEPLDLRGRGVVVSTAPMAITALGFFDNLPEFRRAEIRVRRWRIKGADVHQTIYFTDPEHALYRASITGDLLIGEYAADTSERFDGMINTGLFTAFGLAPSDAELIDDVHQSFGKIAPIDEPTRKRIVFELSHRHGIYSLGRFATWRNILLDDVVHDISVIKRLLRSSGGYDARKAGA